MSLQDVFTATYRKARAVRPLARVTKSKLQRFCMDISLVALSVRTSYLFDAFALPSSHSTQRLEGTLTTLIMALREEISVFKNVLLVHEPASDQLFVLNMGLLRQRLLEPDRTLEHASTDKCQWIRFVRASENPTLLPFAPPQVLEILRNLSVFTEDPIPPYLTLTSQEPLDASALVPLAAFLLEYPIAYVPQSIGQSGYLTNVPLDVYECTLVWSDHATELSHGAHLMLKFSCPCAIGDVDKDVCPPSLVQHITRRFGERLTGVGFSGKLAVRHYTETLPRIAL
ncbi:hypothetical protein OBBRIDRAFT_542773 [Obba rivulosa]|uniref:Uncharacterized protein n=1 Tax=Obba rivulosa TaxID=1052685 RepID=A0A8E2AZP3_9APHY|nr:hypothetical protein OBBRIDRAFT_542773 [Obba rivulosa]